MEKLLIKNADCIYLNCTEIRRYSNNVLITINDNVVFEGDIINCPFFKLKNYKYCSFLKLYVFIKNQYLFLEKEIITYDVKKVNDYMIKKYVSDFYIEIGEILNGN